MVLQENHYYRLVTGAVIKILCVLGDSGAQGVLIEDSPPFVWGELDETFYVKGAVFIWNKNGRASFTPEETGPLDVDLEIEYVEEAVDEKSTHTADSVYLKDLLLRREPVAIDTELYKRFIEGSWKLSFKERIKLFFQKLFTKKGKK